MAAETSRTVDVSPGPLDPEALLCALALAPATYSRNRFFELYRDPVVRRARRRANILRSVIRQLVGSAGVPAGRILHVRELASGQTEVRFEVEAFELTRTTTLDPLELSLLGYALARAAATPTGALDPASLVALGAHAGGEMERAQIEAVLARLVPLPDAG